MDIREEMKTAKAVDALWADRTEGPRNYLGISSLGSKCTKRVWLTFRWACREDLSSRQRRLLERGKREEAYIVKNLRAIGCDVQFTGTRQLNVKLNAWVKGHPDGIVMKGLPESPNHQHILEMKTASDKNFRDIEKNGIAKAKPQYYAQVQLYMLALKIPRSVFYVVNKNTDEVYTERIKADGEFAKNLAELGLDIATSHWAPPQISLSPSWYECKMCPGYSICHLRQEPQKSCRTCSRAEFGSDGKVRCNADGKVLSLKQQQKACDNYLYEAEQWN